MTREAWDAIVIGAGAAGIFAALRAKSLSPGLKLLVLERSKQPLRKVAVSGGGRCNVTHDCDDLDFLLRCYPRGGHRLEPILSRFMPHDTVEWFQSRGVKLKTESDGRMFPVTDNSRTVIDCLLKEAQALGVEIRTNQRADTLELTPSGKFILNHKLRCHKLLLATGGASKATTWLEQTGHEVVPDIPSLFTFCSTHPVIKDLPGLSVPQVHLTLNTEPEYRSEGPLLITHWGVSGPAVLKLSAFAARTLATLDYRATLTCDLLPHLDPGQIQQTLPTRSSHVGTASPFPEIPKRLWKNLTAHLGLHGPWDKLSGEQVQRLVREVKSLTLEITGKGAFKEEFVTSGGLPLKEVDVYTMESKRVPGLFVAGELLDVDGITGGFNFQNAWATGYVAGEGLA